MTIKKAPVDISETSGNNETMNVIIYIRVSSEGQVENFSLDTQLKICMNWAESNNYNVVKVFREEGVSAKTANRPELINLLEYCRKNKSDIHAVVAYRIDRWARETSDYLAIRKKLNDSGIQLLSATEPTGDETPTAKFMETVLASIAQLDNDVRSEKARNGIRERLLSGLPPSNPPIGYKYFDSKTVVKDEENFDQIRLAFELFATGTKTLSEMAKEMNKWKVMVKKKVRKFSKQSLSRIFRNKFYIGVLTSEKYPGEEIQGQHEKMISNSLFFKVQEVLSGRRVNNIKGNVKNEKFPLRGIVSCSACGSKLRAAACKGNGGIYKKYWCPKTSCKGTIPAKDIDEQLLMLLGKVEPSEETIDLFTLVLHAEYGERLEILKKRQRTANRELKEAKEMMKMLVRGHMMGKYPDDIFEEEKAKLENQILACNIVKNDDLISQYDIESICGFIKALLSDLPKAYEVSDYGQKRALIGSIFPSGLVFDEGKVLNHDISPLFRAIEDISEDDVSLSRGGETRTHDLTLPKRALFQLSYTPKCAEGGARAHLPIFALLEQQPQASNFVTSAEGGARTHTTLLSHRILSPACLPIPPPRLKA